MVYIVRADTGYHLLVLGGKGVRDGPAILILQVLVDVLIDGKTVLLRFDVTNSWTLRCLTLLSDFLWKVLNRVNIDKLETCGRLALILNLFNVNLKVIVLLALLVELVCTTTFDKVKNYCVKEAISLFRVIFACFFVQRCLLVALDRSKVVRIDLRLNLICYIVCFQAIGEKLSICVFWLSIRVWLLQLLQEECIMSFTRG